MLPAVFAIGETGTDRKEERIGKCLPNSLGRFMIEQTDRQTERHTVVNDLMSSVKSGKNAFSYVSPPPYSTPPGQRILVSSSSTSTSTPPPRRVALHCVALQRVA